MLEEKIFNDYKQAMKDRDSLKSGVLNFLRAQILNTAIAKKKNKLEDSDCLAVIRKQIKERQDSIEQFKAGNRLDLAEKETRELEILKSYLPPGLTEEEIKKIIEEAVFASGASSLKEMGRVMKEVTDKVAGRAESKLISDLVRERLSTKVSTKGDGSL
jgi:uncharacterized protein YqeY